MYHIALKMLIGDRAKYIMLIGGLTFAALLMTQQSAVFFGLLSWTTSHLRNMRAAIWVVDAKVEQVNEVKAMRDTDVSRVRSVTGVAWAVPLQAAILQSKLSDGNFKPIMIIGLDSTTLVGRPSRMIAGRLEDVRLPNSVIIDDLAVQRLSVGRPRPLQVGDTFEINDKEARIVGICKADRHFFGYPYVFTTADCLDLALQQNSAVLKSQADLEAVHGVIVQTRAIAQPKVRLVSEFSAVDGDSIETVSATGTTVSFGAEERWTAEVRITQSIYEGGRINSALRSARLTKQQSLLNHQTVLANTVLDVRVAYYGLLLAAQQIIVQEAAVNLRQSEVEDATRRFNAGTSKRFNVLRAEVEVANVKPRLIRARNAHRIGKNNLVNLLGFNLPKEVLEDVPLQLTGRLDADAYDIALPDAVARALANRTELAALRTGIGLREEAIISARSNYKPAVQLYAGYGGHSSQFVNDLEREVHGWSAGAQMSWNIFDGKLTAGKVRETTALRDKSKLETEDVARKIELEVRTAYSAFIEAREVLETQKKVQEQAEEALRQVNVLYQEGAMGGTQLDVLNAQTALTEARTTQIQALHDYDVARARLERAIGPAPAGK